jgi:hypothetical protein
MRILKIPFRCAYMLTKTQCFSYAMNLFVLVNHQSRANKQCTNIFPLNRDAVYLVTNYSAYTENDSTTNLF